MADDVPTAAPTTTPNRHVQATRGGRGGVGVKRVVVTRHASHINRFIFYNTCDIHDQALQHAAARTRHDGHVAQLLHAFQTHKNWHNLEVSPEESRE